MRRSRSEMLSLILALLGASTLAFPPLLQASPFDNNPKILLHLMTPTMKNSCGRALLSDCSGAVTSGNLNTPYFAYILVARGHMPDVAGFEVGLSYQDKLPDDVRDNEGIDIFSWTSCATLEFPTPAPLDWPRPGSGNLLAWNTDTVCQTGETAVGGYFYLTAYSTDTLRLIRRPGSGAVTVGTCAATEEALAVTDLGSIAFSSTGAGGCNPCDEPCPEPEAPACEVSRAAIDFQTTTANGSWMWESLTIRNAGGGTLRGQITLDSEAHFILWDDLSFELTAYQSQTIRAVFKPPGVEGTYTTLLRFGDDCPPVTLTGRVVPPVICRVHPAGFGFGYVPLGATETRQFTIWNDGVVPFAGEVTEDCDQFSVTNGAYSLAPGDSQIVLVHFSPTREGRDICPSLRLGTPCGGGWWIEGYGGEYVPPECHVTPTVLDFGVMEVGRNTTWPIHVSNLGGGCIDLRPDISCGTFFWSGRYDTQDDACGSYPVPVNIGFAPGEPGLYECTVSVGLNCARVTLRGEGRLAGAGDIQPDTLDFGTVNPGAAAVMPVTLTNNGPVPIAGSFQEFCGEFEVVGDAGYSLAPGASRSFSIRFKPDAEGHYRCVVDGGPDATVLPCTGVSEGAVPVLPTTWGAIKSRFGRE